MSISHQQLVEKIAKKAGVEASVVDEQLKNLVTEATSVEKGKPFKIEGFGTFRLKKGRLSFDTDEVLGIEINYRYAGMTPIVIQESAADKEAAESEKIETGKVTSSDTKSASEDDKEPVKTEEITPEDEKSVEKPAEEYPQKKEEEKSAETVSKKEVVEKDNKEIVSGLQESEKSASDDAKEKAETSASFTEKKKNEPVTQDKKKALTTKLDSKEKSPFTKVEKKEAASAGKEKKDDTRKTSPAKKSAGKKKEFKKKDNRGLVIGAIAIAVIVLIGFILFLNRNTSDTATTPSQVDVEQTRTEKSQTAAVVDSESEDLTQAEPSSDESMYGNVAEKDNQEEQEAAAVPAQPSSTETGAETESTGDNLPKAEMAQQGSSGYGLEGTLNPNLRRYYSIIIHSLTSEVMAEQQAQTFEKKGFRAVIDRYQTDGKQFFRVGVGQFETIPDAQSAAKELPAPYNKEHFIKRI